MTQPSIRRRGNPVVSGTLGPTVTAVLGLTAIGILLLGGAGAFTGTSAETQSAVLVVLLLAIVTYFIARWLGRVDNDRRTIVIILAGFVAKMVGAAARHWVVYNTYDGASDAGLYFIRGQYFAEFFRHGELYTRGGVTGTRFMDLVSGMAYTVLPRSELAGFFFFAWLSFIGMILFSRAFRRALPQGDHRRYDLLLFFFPTLLFWSSSIGKEAWMLLVLGLASYGLALVLTHRPIGFLAFGLGAWGAAVMRPHIGLMLLASAGPAWLLRPRGRNQLGLSPFAKALGIVALVVGLSVVLTQAERFLQVDALDSEGAEQVADETERRTDTGGSDFDNNRVDSVGDVPEATVTVLFRPLVWETSNAQQAATALESALLALLMALSYRQILALPRNCARHPYVLFAAAFIVLYIVAFSAVNNFGILARQRAQLIPYLLVLLMPLAKAQPDTDNDLGDGDSELALPASVEADSPADEGSSSS